MRKTIKNKILIPLVILFTLSMALLGIFSLKTTNSANADFNVTDTQVRVEETENGRKGMRFVSTISKDIVKGYTDNGYTLTYGTFIMPAHYATDPNHGEINEANTFGESAKYVWGNASEVDGKWWILHVPGAIEEVDADNYEIKASVNMNVTDNWGIKYTSKAYLKAVKADVETEYEFATSATENVSMLDVAVNTMDTADSDLQTVLDGFVSGYKAAGKSVDVAYSIVQKYGEVEVETTGTAEMGTVLDVESYKVPTADTEETARYNEKYYYFGGQDLGSLRVKADGTTEIVIDFTAKAVYSNATAKQVGLYKLNGDKTGREVVGDTIPVEMDGGKVANVPYSMLSDKTIVPLNTETVVEYFPETENVVYKAKVITATALIQTQDDMKYIDLLSTRGSFVSGGITYYTAVGQGEYFRMTNDIDMTGYTGPNYSTKGLSVVGNTSYSEWGFRGYFYGNGHTFYNLNAPLFHMAGIYGQLRNFNIVTTSDASGLLGTAIHSSYVMDISINVTIPENATKDVNVVTVNPTDESRSGTYYRVVVKVNNLSDRTVNVFPDSTSKKFNNCHVFTNATVYPVAPTAESNRIYEHELNDNFVKTTDDFAEKNFWNLSNPQFPVQGDISVGTAETTFAQYKLNDAKTGRDLITNDLSVNVNNKTINVSNEKLQALAAGKNTILATSESKKDFAFITIDKVTAFVNNADDLENILYLAGGGTDASIVDTNYDNFGADELFALTANIDMAGRTPAQGKATSTGGTYGKYGFQGILDGNGYAVTNLSAPLFANLGTAGVVKNLSVVADNAAERSFIYHVYGLVDNCYFDYTASASRANLLTNYAYGSSWKNCVIKINSLSTTSACAINSANICHTVNGWKMNNSIVMTNSPSWNGNPEGLSVAPTVVGFNGITPAIASNFMANGGNSEVWTSDLTFKNFNVINNRDGAWGKYIFTDNTYSARTANTTGYTLSGTDVDVATLSALTDGSYYLKSTTDIINGVLTRDMVQVATGVVSTAQELSKMINLGAVSGNGWLGYIVLANDIDMTGVGILKNTNPDSPPTVSYPSYGFKGAIDGAGYTISNLSDMMFYQLGDWSATIRNLSFYNLSATIANGLGCLTIDNCYFHIVRDTQFKNGNYLYDHIIGGTHGDSSYARTFKMTNSVVRVENNTADKLYLVNNFKSNSSVTFKNVILVADSEKAGITTTALDTSITDNVTIIGLNETYSGDVSGFDSSIWNIAGNHPTFDGFVDATNVGFAYGRHTTVDGVRVENTTSFVGKVAPGVTVTWDEAKDVLLEKDANSNYIRFGSYKTVLKGSDGRSYLVKINIVHVAISTAEDLKNMMISAAGAGQPNACNGQTIMLNGDIDMAGVTGISYSKNPGYNETSWGFAGTFDGNGYTISNLEATLLSIMNASGTIKNVTFKDNKSKIVSYNGGGTLNNVKFDIDASEMSNVYIFTGGLVRKATTLTDCEIVVRNATSTTNIYFEGSFHTANDGSININNVKVTTNDGNFYWVESNATTDLNRTGAVNETFNGTVTVPAA